MKAFSLRITATLGLFFSFAIVSTALAISQGLYCGDGLLSTENGEVCDDGNFINRDGCNSYCQLEDLEPPRVINTDIENEKTGVSTLTKKMKLTFSEPLDPATVNENTVIFKKFNKGMPTTLDLLDGNKELIVNFYDELEGNQDYAIVVQYIKDSLGNMNTDLFVSTFSTGDYIDVKPPNIVARSPGGEYNVAQSVTLTPYIGALTFNDVYIDQGAKIYYTVDGSEPTSNSTKYQTPISIKSNTKLKFFGIDQTGNRSKIETHEYTFSCGELAQAKTTTDYPECKITECVFGYRLQGGICIMVFSDDLSYIEAAATAPLFGSDTPMNITTKPALYVTPEHNGILPRPIRFEDRGSGSVIEFKRDTKISRLDDSPFTGYILLPTNLYSKSFPLNFGFSFKSIFNFKPADGGQLKFDPMIEITIPFTERYNEGADITIFTYDPLTEEYFVHDPSLVTLNADGTSVKILSNSTETFFVAQPGEGYNQIVFKDTINHWAKNYIEQLYRWNMVKGRAKGIFAPDDILTRAEFTKIALNAIGEEVDLSEEIEDPPFYDVELYAWYVHYVKRAKDLGLINGYPDGSFKPEEPINRVEAIKILMAAFKFDLISAGQRKDDYEDVLTWEWYFPSANFALQHKFIDGIRLPGGKIQYDTFGPGRNIKRGEMSKLAVKAIELKNQLQK